MAAKPGQGLIRAQKDEMCQLTKPSTFQEMVGRGCPDASQERFNTTFSCTHIFLSFNAIHGGPGKAEGRVRQQTTLTNLPYPHKAPQGSGWLVVLKELETTQLGVASRGHLISAKRASPKMATLTSCVRFRPGTLGTDATQR